MSKINVNTWEPESSTALTMGASGDTTTVPSGASLVVASGATINITGATQTGFPASGNTVKVAYLVDQKADTNAGGTFTSGSWQHRDLNTEYYDTIGITLSGNEFTLPVGTFYIDWACPAIEVRGHQSRLYNSTNTAVVNYGTSGRADESSDVQTLSTGSATVTVSSGTEDFKIEHRCSDTRATYGFGDNVDFGGVELFTSVKVMQIA